MCFFGGGAATPSSTVVNQTVPAPTPPPTAPAATPTANPTKSPETRQSANPNAVGYGSLIIPRTAISPVSRSVPGA
ncbi:hypothetical protein SAMN02745126_03998 [Enhydrobacter aerosaccus]|uniref:Uncharacterized protein n=1 Tax=Enhydrobacter aerosaccus TaxID=225324 RepID=A0A1T4RNV7_9HYPH|nr:hypothetical protein SAMN02745126_03998 [Enhydrobacter aerosaccus]